MFILRAGGSMELSIVTGKWTEFPTFRSEFSFSDFALTKENSNLVWSCFTVAKIANIFPLKLSCMAGQWDEVYVRSGLWRSIPWKWVSAFSQKQTNSPGHPKGAMGWSVELSHPVLLGIPCHPTKVPSPAGARSSFTPALMSSKWKPANTIDCLKPSNSHPNSAHVNMLLMTFSLGSSASLSRLTFILFFILIYIFNVKSSSGISYHFLNLQFSKSCLFMPFYSIHFF